MLTDTDMELLLRLRDTRVAYAKALDDAIRDVTSDTLVARIMGVSRVTVWRWRKRQLARESDA